MNDFDKFVFRVNTDQQVCNRFHGYSINHIEVSNPGKLKVCDTLIRQIAMRTCHVGENDMEMFPNMRVCFRDTCHTVSYLYKVFCKTI